MGKHKLEEYFRNRIQDHEVFIDKDDLWASLGMEEEKKEKKPWFWMFLGVLAIMILGYSVSELLSGNESMPQSEMVIQSPEQTSTPSGADSGNHGITSTQLANSEETQSTSVSSTSEIKPKKTNHESEINLAIRKETLYPEPVTSTNNQKPIATKSIAKEAPHPKKLESNFVDEVMKPNSNVVVRKGHSIATVPLKREERNLSSVDAMTKLPSLEIGLLKRTSRSEKNFTLPQIQPVSRNPWSIGAYAGVFHTTRELGLAEQESYKALREQTESMLETTTAGIKLKYQSRVSLYASVGAEMQKINERFRFGTQRDTLVDSISVVVTVFDLEGNSTARVTEEDDYMGKFHQEWINYNSHRLINIPVSVGYSLRKGRMNLFAEAASVFTIKRTFEGLLLDEETNVIDGRPIFSSANSMALRLSAGCSYALNGKWNLSAQPTFQTHLNSFSELFSQKYRLFGVQVGVNYKL